MVEAYNFKALSRDLTEILDAEDLQEVIGVGHDWGAGMLSKVTLWFPKRFTKLVFVTTPYLVPGLVFDIDAINKAGVENLGYQPFAYWYFFNSYDAADLIKNHVSGPTLHSPKPTLALHVRRLNK
jgi:soluble epoxide hydrolase/lipid-phosphate phosphatase